MVRSQIEARGVTDARVLAAMRSVPRHEFVPEPDLGDAYDDHPLPIGCGQTISQPYIVAYMCELARLAPADRVLEVGTGSGYHAAVISRLVAWVYSIEIVEALAARAERTIARLGYDNISLRRGDGYFGWPEEAPFDAIIVTAAAERIPPPLLQQLAEGGRLVMPVGQPFYAQQLVLVERVAGEILSRALIPVRFVPLTGERGAAG